MRNEKMYMDLARYYDASIFWKNYRAECAIVHELIIIDLIVIPAIIYIHFCKQRLTSMK